VQAGGSSDGRDLAAAQAEAVFTLAQTIEEGVAYARDLRTRAVAYGRAADSIVILPGLATVIGSTEVEAKRRQDELWELVPIEYSLARLAGTLQIDPALLELDKPLPDPLPLPPNANHTMFQGTVNIARAGISPFASCCARSAAVSVTASSSARPSKLPTTSRRGSRQAPPTVST
jgi:alkanesulfonate monooxygenase SsuD/methylene tetrahydromethanopterin reductase-like flavin-dependent oxidoreductase (luciferase family)